MTEIKPNHKYTPLSQPVRITEQQWTNGTVPLVSISCITYNHAPYIRECIEGFLMQETTFPVEILIHDDASTDGTADIVREYEAKYPQLIKPIYQTKNQYSQGVKISVTYQYPRVQGEFIALCEGDDYWTDRKKLEIQIDAMRRHPDSNLCFHPAIVHDMDGVGEDREICKYASSETLFSLEPVIMGGGGWMPTASLLIRTTQTERIIKFHRTYPGMPVGDIVVQTLASEHGAIFIPYTMSIYRKNTPGSWTQSMKDINKKILHRKKEFYYYDSMTREFAGSREAKFFIRANARNSFLFSIYLIKRRKIYQAVRFLLTALFVLLKYIFIRICLG